MLLQLTSVAQAVVAKLAPIQKALKHSHFSNFKKALAWNRSLHLRLGFGDLRLDL